MPLDCYRNSPKDPSEKYILKVDQSKESIKSSETTINSFLYQNLEKFSSQYEEKHYREKYKYYFKNRPLYDEE